MSAEERPLSPFDVPPQPLAEAPPANTLQDAVIENASNLILELEKGARYYVAIGMLLAKKIEDQHVTFEGIKGGVIKDDNTRRSRAAATRTKMYACAAKHINVGVGTYSREAKRTISWLREFKDVVAEMRALPEKSLDEMPVDKDMERLVKESAQRRKLLKVLLPKKVRRAK